MPTENSDSPAANLDPTKLRVVACVGGKTIARDFPPADISEYIKDSGTTVWVDIRDPGPAEAQLLSEEFEFHPLAVEDACKGDQRPKIEEYEGYVFIVAYTLPPPTNGMELTPIEVHAFIGRNYVVTVHHGPAPPLDEASRRWGRGDAMLNAGVGFLAYTVFDAMVDAFFPAIDHIGDRIDECEREIFKHPEQDFVPEILSLKRGLVELRRVLAPMRDVFLLMLRHDLPLFAPESRVYFQNVYDHVTRQLENLEVLRELATGALDAYMTVLSNRLNATMQTLTVFTIALAFLGAVFGAWGMNVDLPFAGSKHAFWIIVSVVAVIVLAGFAWARRQRWL